jgi:hypothetical protein
MDHEQREADTARAVARQNRIADVPAPRRQALARQASTWSSRSMSRRSLAIRPNAATIQRKRRE